MCFSPRKGECPPKKSDSLSIQEGPEGAWGTTTAGTGAGAAEMVEDGAAAAKVATRARVKNCMRLVEPATC